MGGQHSIPPMRSKAEKLAFAPGDSFHLASPGGGGFGDPLTRDVAAVEDDLNDGLIDLETASRIYRVVVAEIRLILDRPVYRLDRAATLAAREAL